MGNESGKGGRALERESRIRRAVNSSATGAFRPATPFVVSFFTFPSGRGNHCTYIICFVIIFFSSMRHAVTVSVYEIMLTAYVPAVMLSSRPSKRLKLLVCGSLSGGQNVCGAPAPACARAKC